MNQESTRHDVGHQNVQVFGLDIHPPVFIVSAAMVVTLVVGTLLFPDSAAEVFGSMRGWITTKLDWFFLISGNLLLLFCFALAFTGLGKVRLGGPDAKPRYGYPGWFAMLFAAGVGIGLMFFGVLEPVTHTLNPPLDIDPGDVAIARSAGMSAAIFHWGLHAWAFYGLVALSLAFFCFNRGLPLTMRSAFYPIIGDRAWGWPGHIIDIVAVLATLLGLAVSLGFGAEQIAGGLNYLVGFEPSNLLKVLIIVAIISVALISVARGLDRGVKRLSEINMVMAGLLLLFVFIAGPTPAFHRHN